MPAFGSFALLFALILCAYTLLAGTWSLRHIKATASGGLSAERIADTARRSGIACFFAVSASVVALIWASLTNDFSVSYILHHSNRELPAAYKFAALWSGQEGSLLLWAWLLSAYGFVLRIKQQDHARLAAYASTILAGIQVFFLLLLNCAAPPFARVAGPLPDDGFGLSPLLQYPEMVIHPPMLYLGYVGFSVPFAFALGALMMRYPGEQWIRIARRWTLVTWTFLTCGIFLGAHWAYAVLGWGGYWGWDPVENASLMPWLAGTAFLHSIMMQEKRGMMKRWTLWLIFSTFLLSILGTLLTRSGIVSSVHAFAQSSIGNWFWSFLCIVFVVCLLTYLRNRDYLKTDGHLESLVSRESGLLYNNLVLLAACFTVLWGTLFPLLSEYLQGTRVSIGPAFYNRVAVPTGIFLLLLTGIGPLLPWQNASLSNLRKSFLLPSIAGIVAALLLFASGIRPFISQGTFYAFVTWTISAMVITAIILEFCRGVCVVHQQTQRNLLSSAILLVGRNTRRYGGYLVHFGLVVIFVGIAGSALNQSKDMELNLNQSMSIGPYRLVCLDYTKDSNLNYDTDYAMLDVYRGSTKVTRLVPERRFYVASQQPLTVVANHSTLLNDLYVVYAGRDPDTQHPILRVYLNPLVAWIWIGVGIIVTGSLLALTPLLKPPCAPESLLTKSTTSPTSPFERRNTEELPA